jgi:hypothetical protein
MTVRSFNSEGHLVRIGAARPALVPSSHFHAWHDEDMMTDQSTKELYKRAIELSQRVDERFLELSRTLRLLKETDPAQFRLCIENSRISRRKAFYLIRLETFEKLKVPDKRLQAIGWTRLRVIEPHITKSNLKDLLKLAETSTTRELMAMMAGGTAQTKPHCVLMYFSEDEYAKFAEAILAHGGKKSTRGLVGKEKALVSLIASHEKLKAQAVKGTGTSESSQPDSSKKSD